jgi:radical SAM superfamily enzyme YgiQ (UPF0313 family)
MNILLVYPSQLDANGQPMRYRQAYMPPLALALVAALTPERHRVRVINDMVEAIDYAGDYDLVGITALTSQAPRAYQIADRFRAQGTRVVIGGIHASLLPDEAAAHADAVVIGEAEELWEGLLADAESGRLQPRYTCTSYPSLDRLLIPRWDGFDLSRYRNSIGPSRMPRLQIYTTRGCLYACKYCTVSKFFGKTYRHKPIANVLREIEATRADAYFFVDDNIVCDFDYSAELFKALRGTGIRWLSQASTQLLDKPELIDLAAAAGCKSLFLGIESISPAALRSVRKGFNRPDAYPELFARLERAGIRPLVSMMVGLDQDTPEDIQHTLDYLLKHRVQNVYLSIYSPLPGTDLYAEMEQAGRIIERDWSKYDLAHVVCQPQHFTPAELERTYWQLFTRLYAPGAIGARLLTDLVGLRSGPAKLLRNAAIQMHMYQQVRQQVHPLSMGIGRLPGPVE